MKRFLALWVVTIVLGAIGCEENNFEGPRNYFTDNKIGYGADYGVMKRFDEHVISVHGFSNDLEVCLEIVEMLNEEEPDTYTCQPLNI